MIPYTVTIACPRLSFDEGKPVECGCDIDVECDVEPGEPATRDYPGSADEYDVLDIPDYCDHTDDGIAVAYTAVEAAEWRRRAQERAERHDFDEYKYRPCTCGDRCVC